MTRTLPALVLLTAVAAFGAACSSSSDSSENQEKFGVRMARMNLWREALFRFTRAVEINPADAGAHSNLAVAYEANGDFENAAKHYREAMRLDKTNPFIQKNYSRYVEFNSRNKKRQQQKRDPSRTASAPAGSGAATPPVAGGPVPPVVDDGPTPPVPAAPAPQPVPVPESRPQPPSLEGGRA